MEAIININIEKLIEKVEVHTVPGADVKELERQVTDVLLRAIRKGIENLDNAKIKEA
jgi:hypothetical protein